MTLRLMIPGPAEVSEDVLRVMGEPVRAHYGTEWTAIHNETLDLLRQVMQTSNRMFLLAGSGSLGNDAAVSSFLRDGDKVIAGSNGMFGNRLIEIMRGAGAQVIEVQAEPGTPLAPCDFSETLAQHPDAALVAAVHLETSTGVLNPVRAIAQAARTAGVPVMVDAVSSLAGTELPVDEWGIDICTSASQKCLSAPPGLAMVAVSARAWEWIERPGGRGWYLSLPLWDKYAADWADSHPFPVTMPTSLVLALREGLRGILAEGLENRIAKYQRMATRLRTGLRALGMPPVMDDANSAPVLTAAWVPAGTTSTEIVAFLIDKYAIQITRGFGELRDRVVRIGHMGSEVTEELIDALLAGLRDFKSQC